MRVLPVIALVAFVAGAAPLGAVNNKVWDPSCACFREREPEPEPVREKVDPIAKATKGMEKHEGFFDLYLGDDGEVWVAVPESLLDRMLLGVTTQSRGDASRMLLNMPLGDEAIEFRMNHDGERVDLVLPQLNLRISDDSDLAEAFAQGTWDGGVVASLEPKATRKADDETEAAYLLDVTDWVMSAGAGSQMFAYFAGPRARIDNSRSRLVSAAAYPTNLEFEIEATVTGGNPPPMTIPGDDMRIGLHLSLLLLPEEPMVGRLSDDRAGYFTTDYYDMGVQTTDGRVKRLAHRWRLEKADPDAAMSDPVTPITFYVDPTVPERWRPYVAEGIELWNMSYEEAGFTNAIRAVLPGDEDWPDDYAVGDARYSTVSWAPSVSSTFAIGPSNVDPRSGEIVNADIVFMSTWIQAWTDDWETVAGDMMTVPTFEELQSRWDAWERLPAEIRERVCERMDIASGDFSPFLMRSALLADGIMAPGSDIPEEFIGEALVEVVMHEVGHTIGLRHNFRSSADIPWEHINDQEYTHEHGLISSVMDYASANVSSDRDAQGDYYSRVPGDYDDWVIRYGYTQVEGEVTAEMHPDLEAILEENSTGLHSFGTDEDNAGPFGWDPATNYWDLSDDPISFYADRMALARSLRDEMADRTVVDGEAWADYLYGVLSLVGEVNRGGQYLAKYIGGHHMSRAHRGDPEAPAPITPVSAADQRRALAAIVDILTGDDIIPDPEAYPYMVQSFWSYGLSGRSGGDLTYDIHATTYGRRMSILGILFEAGRMERLRDSAWAMGGDALTPADVIGAVTDGVWGDDLAASDPTSSFNRDLQAGWVDMLLGMRYYGNPDLESLATATALAIHDSAADAISGGGLDEMTSAHYVNTVHKISEALDLG